MKQLRIAIDFDGTIVVSDYPKIGRLMTNAKETINKWYSQGHIISINTCRAEAFLDDCKSFLADNDIKYHFINENDPALVEMYGMDTRKMSADIYFDDKAIGGFCGWAKADEYVTIRANRKPVIICIVGRSGAGKTTLADYIEVNFGVKMIQSRTTRAPRYEGEDGHTFVSSEEFDSYSKSDMLAFTTFGDNRYCCLTEDVREESTYVIDEKGLIYLKETFGDVYDIHSILVTCNKAERIARAGEERVARDEGMFNLQEPLFDFVWRTDSWREESMRRDKEREQLHEFINKSLSRWS